MLVLPTFGTYARHSQFAIGWTRSKTVKSGLTTSIGWQPTVNSGNRRATAFSLATSFSLRDLNMVPYS